MYSHLLLLAFPLGFLVDQVVIEIHPCFQLALVLHDQGFGDIDVPVELVFDGFRVDVFAVGHEDHVLGPAADVQVAVPVEMSQVSVFSQPCSSIISRVAWGFL